MKWVSCSAALLSMVLGMGEAHGVMRALSSAATGLEAQQANIERLSNDLANVNTDGYKRSINEFHDLFYETIKDPGARLGDATVSPVGIQKGMGVRVGAMHKSFEQGPFRMTYNDFDLAIMGQGFFTVQSPDGGVLYTRRGAFKRDPQGRLQNSSGMLIVPQIVIPSNAVKINVKQGGEVTIQTQEEGEVVIGQVQIALFQNPEGLTTIGASMFAASTTSGAPIINIPGEGGAGYIRQGGLEGSNVNVPNSMVEMISTQRAYEMNTKVMGVADKMLETTVNIR